MSEVEYSVRVATGADLPAIQAALACAVDWRGEGGWDAPAAFIESIGLAYLLADWGRPGDAAVVALVGDLAVGAAWYRQWSESVPSYGYVDDATPEIGLGVDPGYRGQGIGTALLIALQALAVERGVSSLSLSVDRDNPAIGLYRRFGFEHYADVDAASTMLRRLVS